MKRLFLMIVGLLAMACAARAQESELLDRLRVLEQRMTTLEKQVAGETTAPTADVAPKTSSSVPKAKSGWSIDVLPYLGEEASNAPILRKRVDIGPISFGLHVQDGPNRQPVLYKGSALFEAKEDGSYTFNIAAEFSHHFRCEGSLALDGTPILSFAEIKVPTVVSGTIELRKGTYDIEHRVGCWLNGGKNKPLGRNRTDERAKDIRYSVKLLGPADDAVREFNPDELFVTVK